MAKASELRLLKEESDALKAEFPDEAFRAGAAGKENLIYIEHPWLRNRFDEVLGVGQAVIVKLQHWMEDIKGGVRVYFDGALIVRGCYITRATGDMCYYENNPSQNLGDALEGAETECFRRCAKKFGVGLQAWSKTWCEGWWARKGTGTPTPSGDPDSKPFKAKPPCPKCGKTASVIVGKAEYGGGYVCFKKKNGCGHKWEGKDVRDGTDAAPAKEHASILSEWEKILDPDTVNEDTLNGEITQQFRAIPGKHPERAKVWQMIVKFAEKYGFKPQHGGKFVKTDWSEGIDLKDL
jgi:hypothetical protein